MDNPRPEKVAVVDEVQARLASSDAAIITEYRGMTVAQMSALRRQLRPAGGEYKVYKNTLVRIAANNLSLDLDALLVGPTAIAFIGAKADGSSGDIAGVAKAIRGFARDVPALVVKGGLLGTQTIDADDARNLADLPSREQVLSQIAGLFEAPLSQMASLLEAPVRDVVYAVQALIDKQGGAPADQDGDVAA
ncbi:MAG: 50S ribosomal protein L10 [Acidimicrobiales bacterium]